MIGSAYRALGPGLHPSNFFLSVVCAGSTLNECATFVELGHATGVFAPGLKLPPSRLNQVRHHALLAHGLAVQAMRARSRAGTQTGPAENVSVCVPVIETPEHIRRPSSPLASLMRLT